MFHKKIASQFKTSLIKWLSLGVIVTLVFILSNRGNVLIYQNAHKVNCVETNTLSPASIWNDLNNAVKEKAMQGLEALKAEGGLKGKVAGKVIDVWQRLNGPAQQQDTSKEWTVTELLKISAEEFVKLGDKINQDERPQALKNLEKWLTADQYAKSRDSIIYMIEQGRFDELFDSFARPLKFGTGGRRGLVGIGPNRFNEWTLAESVKGHVDWLFSEYGKDAVQKRGVDIVGDVRKYPGKQDMPGWGEFPEGNPLEGITSMDFIRIASQVYAAYGVPTYIIESPRTTPQVSIMTKFLGKLLDKPDPIAGVVISSSHNQPWYNGIKFYIDTGSQLVPPFDNNLVAASNRAIEAGKVDRMELEEAIEKGLVTRLAGETLKKVDEECQKIALESYGYLKPEQRNAVIAYDSMHGTGGTWSLPIFLKSGYRVRINPDWLKQDGDFPSAPLQVANPEVDESFNNVMALAKGKVDTALELKHPDYITAKDEVIEYLDNYMDTGIRVAVVKTIQKEADVAMTMDPDADRMGVAFADTDGTWHGFNENDETNLMLVWAKCKLEARKRGKETLHGEEVYGTSTIVTTPLAGKLMNYLGVKTKFKMPNLTEEERKNPIFNGVYVPQNGEEVDLEAFFVGFKNPSNFADLINALVTLGKLPKDTKVIVRVEEGEGGAEETDAANDKDSAVLLTIADQLSLEKKAGGTPVEMLMKIYKSVGVSAVRMVPMMFADAKGAQRIAAIMDGSRNNPPKIMGDFKVEEVRDYQTEKWGGQQRKDEEGNWALTDNMMKNVVRLDLALTDNAPEALANVADAKVVKRPSGTEPKNKDCCHLVLNALGVEATTEQVDADRKAINTAGDLLRRATLQYSYEKSGTLEQVPQDQHERLLDLHDFMTTDAKLGYLEIESELWTKAEEVAQETLSPADYRKWVSESLAAIGVKMKDAPILLTEAIKSLLKLKLAEAKNKEGVAVFIQNLFSKQAGEKLYQELTGDNITFTEAEEVKEGISINVLEADIELLKAKSVEDVVSRIATLLKDDAMLANPSFEQFITRKLEALGLITEQAPFNRDRRTEEQIRYSV